MPLEDPPAKPAATVLLLRDGAAGLEVFMVDRHHEMEGFAGARVFPGGRVDAVDVALAKELPELGLPAESLPFRIAAIRETFEEAGILLARPKGEDGLISGARLETMGAAREAVHASAAEFPKLLAREKLTLAVDLLIPYSHWITPIGAPKRYDTHFFVTAAPLDQVAAHCGRENVDSVWVSPRQTLADAAAGTNQVRFPTRMNLQPLLESTTVAAALAAARGRKVVTVLPEIMRDDNRFTARLPLEAGYGGEIFEKNKP